MKRQLISLSLILLLSSFVTFGQDSENKQLWLLTATISRNYSMHRDTSMSFSAGNMRSDTEKNASAKISAKGQVTAIIENFAENPAKDFSYHTDMGDPVSITVTGQGSYNSTSNDKETINGKLVHADIRSDNVSGSAEPRADIQFDFNDEYKYFGISVYIKGVGSYQGKIFDGMEWKDYGGDYDDYGIGASGGGDPTTDKNCTMTKTTKGYQCSWKMSENTQRSNYIGTEYRTDEITLQVSLTPYKESDKPQITLIGCSELGVGEQTTVIASAKPEGGTFRFWVEPGSMMTVDADGSSANLTGLSPEKGTFFAEYTTPDGKTAQSSQVATCVKVENYNEGKAIQIGLYDADGKKKTGMKTVPVKAEPENASELVKFEVSDPGILSALGVGDEVTLQALRTGTATLQAKTRCGETTGPAVEVEVTNCDEETIATLERMMAAAQEGQKGAYQAIERIVGTKEFEELDSKIAESTGKLAVKTTGLIIGTLAGGTTAGAGVETAAGIYGKASNVMDILKGGEPLEQVSNLAQLIVELGGSAMQQAIAGSIETLSAANEFGTDLGKMIGANRQLQSAIKEAEHWNKVVEDMVKRQNLCRGSKQPQRQSQEPKPVPEPTPTEPTAQTQKPPKPEPTTPTPPVENPPAQPTTPDEPSGDGTEVSPPSPTSPPRQVGLPYSPSSCGCGETKTLEVAQTGFSSLQTGMENLGKCVDDFSKGPLTNYIQTLQDWQTVLNSLLEATKAKPAEFKMVSDKSLPQMETLLGQTKSFDTAGKAFINGFNKCPDSMKSGFGLMQSAGEITVDSIKTKY